LHEEIDNCDEVLVTQSSEVFQELRGYIDEIREVALAVSR